eukprot:2503639-Lingulodinium_polyedra.AAC.1
MAWHQSWPGLLVLFASAEEADNQEGLRLLAQDWQAFEAAKNAAGQSAWVAKAVQKSPFQMTIMGDVARLACAGLPESQ